MSEKFSKIGRPSGSLDFGRAVKPWRLLSHEGRRRVAEAASCPIADQSREGAAVYCPLAERLRQAKGQHIAAVLDAALAALLWGEGEPGGVFRGTKAEATQVFLERLCKHHRSEAEAVLRVRGEADESRSRRAQ